MPGPEDLQVSHLDPGHGLHVTCMHSVTGFEVRDLSVFWAGNATVVRNAISVRTQLKSTVARAPCVVLFDLKPLIEDGNLQAYICTV